jgi:hypothetical protein
VKGANIKAGKHRPGRPPKFGRAARAVTVTLPEDVLSRLLGVDSDLGRAIVTISERATKPRAHRPRPAELAAYGSHAVILVNPARVLNQLPGVQLVPISNGRALISLDRDTSITKLELDLRDALERDGMNAVERGTVEAIGNILRQSRQSARVAIEERTIIVLESKRRRRRIKGAD